MNARTWLRAWTMANSAFMPPLFKPVFESRNVRSRTTSMKLQLLCSGVGELMERAG